MAGDSSGHEGRGLRRYIKYLFFHAAVITLSLSLAWVVFRELARGAAGAPAAPGVESAIKATFPQTVLVFSGLWLAITLWRNRGPTYLTFRQYAGLVSFHAVLATLFFRSYPKQALFVHGLSFLFIPLFLVLLFAILRLRSMALTSFNTGHRNTVLSICFALLGYTVLFPGVGITPGTRAIAFAVSALSLWAYILLKREARAVTAVIFAVYAAVAASVFSPTMGDVFRGDYWYIATLFDDPEALSLPGLRSIAFFEMFGDVRFQPLAHLVMFARHMLFGNSVVLYNVGNVLLHAAVAFLIFLVLAETTGERRLSFLMGLLFVTLPGHFDTIAWTYHLYIVAGTATALLAVFLVCRAKTARPASFIAAVFLALVSIFFYEPAALAPAALFFFFLAFSPDGERRTSSVFLAGGIALAYLFYLGAASYGLSIAPESRMSLRDMIAFDNVREALRAVLENLWESGFLKNTGVPPDVQAKDVVYLPLPRMVLTDPALLPRIAAGVFVASLFVFSKRSLYIALSASGLALSYFFLISLGRVLTNEVSYITSQPRYQYFPNALLLVAVGALLSERYRKSRLGVALSAALFMIFFWNTQNALHATKTVAAAMKPMDAHYQRIKGFLSERPSSRLFLDFIPDTQGKFPLGTDIALDVLFRGRTTKFLERADYIYDGDAFRKNAVYRAGEGPGEEGVRLSDFTVSWMYRESMDTPPRKEVVVAGSDKDFPRISVNPSGYIDVVLRKASGEVDSYRLNYPHTRKDPGDWASMAVEKDGDSLCLIYDGRLEEKVAFSASYTGWEGDGVDLLGSHFRGSRVPAYVARLFIQSDAPRYGCAGFSKGDVLGVDIKRPW